MISRYKSKEIDKIWTEENKIQKWVDVEIFTCEAWVKEKVMPKADLDLIKKNLKVDIKLMNEIEMETKHDIVAFTRMLSKSLGQEKRWIHYGLTSTDVVDTAQNSLIKESNEVIEKSIKTLMNTIKKQALDNEKTLIIGRTHGISAEPTSLGLKFALWYEELKRQMERFVLARKDIEVGKLSGAVGNFANLPPKIEEFVCKKMGLGFDNISTQVIQRDRHLFLMQVLANISSTIEKIAIQIRLMQQSDLDELREPFAKNQKGSSAMPHKQNPIGSENICGLARLVRHNASVSYENNLLWHERDISHSSNERVILPDTYNILDFIINRLNNILKDIRINKINMLNNLKKMNNIFYSQTLVLEIIKTSKISREEIYDFIQKNAFEAFEQKKDFKEVLIKNGIDKYIKKDKLNKIFDLNYFLKNTNEIYKRVFN